MPKREEVIKPKQLNKLAWFYEDKDGLTVCVQRNETTDAGIVTIPWRKIRALAKRHSN